MVYKNCFGDDFDLESYIADEIAKEIEVELKKLNDQEEREILYGTDPPEIIDDEVSFGWTKSGMVVRQAVREFSESASGDYGYSPISLILPIAAGQSAEDCIAAILESKSRGE